MSTVHSMIIAYSVSLDSRNQRVEKPIFKQFTVSKDGRNFAILRSLKGSAPYFLLHKPPCKFVCYLRTESRQAALTAAEALPGFDCDTPTQEHLKALADVVIPHSCPGPNIRSLQ